MTTFPVSEPLDIAGETIYAEQFDPMKPDDAQWLEQAAGHGTVLVIGGDNLVITGTVLDVEPAAALGTLVIGKVSVRS